MILPYFLLAEYFNNKYSKRMKTKIFLRFFFTLIAVMVFTPCFPQVSKSNWKTIVDDEIATISYNTNITTDKQGHHIVWVKAVYKTTDWQRYFADQIGSRSLVKSTKTKAQYRSDYKYTMVRQVICYDKSGKQLYNSGDDTSAGWGPVNASDPVGLVGEFLWDQQEKNGY